VGAGGRSVRHPDARFVTGFAMALGDSPLERARVEAAADLASRISVRIEHELRDVSEEKDGEYSYKVASVARSTSDIRLAGLAYETWGERPGEGDGGRVYALAILDRASAVAHRRRLSARSLDELRACLESGARQEAEGREAQALETYESCRRPIAEALEHDAVARALGAGSRDDQSGFRQLVDASRQLDERIGAVLRRPVSSLEDAVESLAIQLGHQGLASGTLVAVAPFTYGTADLSSSFGRQVALELEAALTRRAGGPGPGVSDAETPAQLAIRGVYLERGEEIRLSATAKQVETARLVAAAESSLPRRALPDGLDLRPANFEKALRDQRELADGELLSGDLRVELWTERGKRGVLYSESEELKLFFRVNRPAWVRLVYVLQSGVQVPIDQAYYVDGSKVNLVVEYPETFEVVPPFGVEHIYATAFTREPVPLGTRFTTIDGVEYEVVADDLKGALRKTRGLKRKSKDEVSEAFVTVTTVRRP
jgi:hypothetical protein